MMAYSKNGLRHLRVVQEAGDALARGLITEAEHRAITERHPVPFYTPPPAIRVGLFLLTAMATAFTLALFLITFASENFFSHPAPLFSFFTLLSYGMLEVFARRQQHFCSGVDDALLWATVLFFISALASLDGLPAGVRAALLALLTGYLALRFTDAPAAAACALSGLATVFYAYGEAGAFAKGTMPFPLMGAAAALFFLSLRLSRRDREKFYAFPLIVVRLVALLAFYAAGNYFVVREAGAELLGLSVAEGEDIPLGPLFRGFTVAVPLLYLYRGVLKKDRLLLRAGLLLTGVMVLTFRYYYDALAAEWLMILCGAVMLALAWGLIRYLKQPRKGFTYAEEEGSEEGAAEVLAILGGFGTLPPQEAPQTGWGGGSGGGAGASGTF